MSASEFYDRATATTEFLEHGLGANLSDVASGVATTAFQSDEADERERRSSALYAAGTIMERAAWLAIGNWIGYFESARVASDGEREFFQEYADAIPPESLPDVLRDVRNYLANREESSDSDFLRNFNGGFRLKEPMVAWYPCFQAMLTVSEMLSGAAITTFFRFLQNGDEGIFKEYEPKPEAVMDALRAEGDPDYVFINRRSQESVLAGFIRYTEYLSAMDGLFPLVQATDLNTDPSEIPARIVDRDLLLILQSQVRSRYPSDEYVFDRFSAVLFAFVRLAQRQFDSHRSLAVQWQADRTVAEILNFSQRFFFPFTPHNTEEGQADPQDADARRARVIAMDKRIQEIRAEEDGQQFLTR